ncbi:MAG TPA: carboxypeptidase-like regulatory domain-containing protein [Longimicrobium sp.]|nr:carboxypeptidase-like regulatory domain-containing protein [Longimicrobium sp.]
MELQTGALFGTVTDDAENPLPATVVLQDTQAPRIQLADLRGGYMFVDLQPGTYTVRAELEGFETAEFTSIVIDPGGSVNLDVTLVRDGNGR